MLTRKHTSFLLLGGIALPVVYFVILTVQLSFLMPAHRTEVVEYRLDDLNSEFMAGLVAHLSSDVAYECESQQTRYVCYRETTRIVLPFEASRIYLRGPLPSGILAWPRENTALSAALNDIDVYLAANKVSINKEAERGAR